MLLHVGERRQQTHARLRTGKPRGVSRFCSTKRCRPTRRPVSPQQMRVSINHELEPKWLRCCCFGDCIMCVCVCMSTPHTRASQLGCFTNHAQPGDVGLRMLQMALANPGPVLHRNISLGILLHTPCLGISTILTGMILNPESMSYEVCRSFSVQSDSFNASTRPANPVISITTFEARQNCALPA